MREEDDLRAALHTLERHTPDPDRMLAAIRASGRPARPDRPRRRWLRAAGTPRPWGPGWIAPLAAAAAVVAVVASSVVVAKAFAPGPGAGGRPRRVSTTAQPLPTIWGGVPGYFAEVSWVPLTGQPRSARLPQLPIPQTLRSHAVDIVAASTGRVAATVRLPGYVGALSASAGAFFAASVTGSVTTFYEIRLAPGGARATMTELPIPPVTAPLYSIAASPNGSKLAISTEVPTGHSGYAAQNLIVAATATGTERRWRTPAQDAQGGSGLLTMNWLANGTTLAITWESGAWVSPSSSLRLLNTAARGDDLLASTPVVRLVNTAGSFGDYTISPDGKAVFGIVGCVNGGCPWTVPGKLGGGVGGHRSVLGSLIQFGPAGGSPRARYIEPEVPGVGGQNLSGTCTDPLWIGNAGRTVLLPCYQHYPATATRKAATVIHVVLLTGNRITQLPWLTAPGYGLVTFPGMPLEGGPVGFPAKP